MECASVSLPVCILAASCDIMATVSCGRGRALGSPALNEGGTTLWKKILACLSPSPSNPKILRAAADMAGDSAELIALFVETPQFPRLANTDRRRLQENMRIAEQLGAAIQTVSGDDVAFQLAEYAKLSGIRKIVLGQSDFKLSILPSQATLPDRLAEYLPDAEIHVIPDQKRGVYLPPQRIAVSKRRILMDIVVTLAMLTAATLLGTVLYGSNLSNSSIMMVYLLAVLLIAVITSHRAYSMAASVLRPVCHRIRA